MQTTANAAKKQKLAKLKNSLKKGKLIVSKP